MTRTKKAFVTLAIAVAVTGGASAPAFADLHATGGTATTQDLHATGGDVSTQDLHATVTPQD